MAQATKGEVFRALHQKGNPFVLANAWDAGSAKLLVAMGAQAIGTTSAGYGITKGVPDMGQLTRDEHLSHAADLVAAVNVPVSGDFENGFGDDPDTVAETVRLAAEVGLAGICIEDTALPSLTPYEFDLAVERIKAAMSAARALPDDFVLCARADGIMNGQYDIHEAIRRLQAFEAVGADCLYAPALHSIEDAKTLLSGVTAPVNILTVKEMAQYNRAEFAKMGVARISLGSTLARSMVSSLIEKSQAILQNGDFSDLGEAIVAKDIDALMDKGTSA